MERLPRNADEWKYRTLGPTTKHLLHEFLLLIALLLLTISSFHAIYKGTLGLIGDYQYMILSSLWLSRGIVVRWICTWSNTTNRTPSIAGVFAHLLSSDIMAGQYFDRPSPQIVSKQIGTTQSDEGRSAVCLSSFFPPAVMYAWQFVKVWCWYPLMSLEVHMRRWLGKPRVVQIQQSMANAQARKKDSFTHSGITQVYSQWNKFWTLYGPSVQMILPLVTLTYYLWYFFLSESPSEVSHALTMNTQTGESLLDEADRKPQGSYKKVEEPTMTELLFSISSVGTILGIVLFGRLVLPIPDLVAGSNVLKAVRNESKLFASQSNVRRMLVKTTPVLHILTLLIYAISQHQKPSKAKLQRETVDQPWAEQYHSIVGENRFRLVCKIAVVRLIEHLFVCALLPRMAFTCRATGHCPAGASLAELSRIFFPAGITSAIRNDFWFRNHIAVFAPDRGSAIMTSLSVSVVTWTILLAQAATLNRSYLGIMGYIAGEWTVVDNSDPILANATPSQWDMRRRYKKGDLIVQNYRWGGRTVYKATSNSPEGRPFDMFLRISHDLFRNELGHPATSRIVSLASAAQIGMVVLTMGTIGYYHVMDYNYGSLLWVLVANLVAAVGVISFPQAQYDEFQKLAEEISG